MIKILENINVEPLLELYTKIESNIQWTEYKSKGKQAGLQYKQGENPWTSAVGKARENEILFDELNPFFQNSIFEDIINKFKLTRSRLMWVNPMSCYSMHIDLTPRIHIPIVTNPNCYFVFKSGLVENLPLGNVYWVDTRQTHTFINCSDHSRLHFVGVVKS